MLQLYTTHHDEFFRETRPWAVSVSTETDLQKHPKHTHVHEATATLVYI
jgi:hypothetical protein